MKNKDNILCHSEAKAILSKVKSAWQQSVYRELFHLALIIQLWNTLSLLLVATKWFRFQTRPLKSLISNRFSLEEKESFQGPSRLASKPCALHIYKWMEAFQKQQHILFPLLEHFENFPVCVYATYRQKTITTSEPLRVITNYNSLRLYLTFVMVVSSFLGIKSPKIWRL